MGRRSALQVLHAYDPRKRPLTMIECVVLPRDEAKISEFISYMEKVLGEEQVVAGTHGHAGDATSTFTSSSNLSQQMDREKLIHVMTKITQKVCAIGGSMSAEHADGRTRGVILPHVFGLELFDLFVQIKELMDPRIILHPGVKIIKEARNKKLDQAIEELVGIEEKDSRLNLARFRDFSHLFSGVCSFCSQCADICPVFDKLPEQFTTRSEAAPTFKRALAMALDRQRSGNPQERSLAPEDIRSLSTLRPVHLQVCHQCQHAGYRHQGPGSSTQQGGRARHQLSYGPSRIYNSMIRFLGATQGIWRNKVSRKILSILPRDFFHPSSLSALLAGAVEI